MVVGLVVGVGGGVFEGKDKRYAERKEKKEKNTHNILV